MSAGLYADEYAYIGQDYLLLVTDIPPDAYNVTLRIVSPEYETVFYMAWTERPDVIEHRVPVSRDWRWGHGYVEWHFENESGPFTDVRMFETVCSGRCMDSIIHDAVRGAVAPVLNIVYGLTAVVVFLAMAYIASASHWYAKDNGCVSWYERIAFVFRPLRRSMLRIDMMQQRSGYIPEEQMKTLLELRDAIAEADKERRARQAYIRERRFVTNRLIKTREWLVNHAVRKPVAFAQDRQTQGKGE